jgi:hypothetical protein
MTAIETILRGVQNLPLREQVEVAATSNSSITFSADLLRLLGISVVALVGSPLIESTKKSRDPDDKVPPQSAAVLTKNAMVPASQAAQDKTVDPKTQQGSGTSVSTPVPNAQSVADQQKAKTDSLAKTITDNAQGFAQALL